MSNEKPNLCLVDLNHLHHIAFYLQKRDGKDPYAYEMDTLRRYSSKAHSMIICADAPPYKRKERYPEYKQNRKPSEPGLKEFIQKVTKLIASEFKVTYSPGHEADDVIATFCRQFSNEKIVVVTPDKDLYCLITRNGSVKIYNPMKRKISNGLHGWNDCRKVIGVYPNQVIEKLCLEGDAADNFKGVPGIGEKGAIKIIEEFGTFEGALANCPDTGIVTKLEKGKSSYLLARDMATLVDNVPIKTLELSEEEQKLLEMKEEDTMTEAEAIEETVEAPAKEAPALEPKKPEAWSPQSDHKEGHVLTDAAIAAIELMVKKIYRAPWAMKKSGCRDQKDAFFTLLSWAIEGAELGHHPLNYIRQGHLMHGQLTRGAHEIIGLAMAHPQTKRFECVENNEKMARYEYVSRSSDKVLEFTYTVAQAEKDGLQWARKEKLRSDMVRKTAGVRAARLFCPQALMGFYAAEEMDFDKGFGD